MEWLLFAAQLATLVVVLVLIYRPLGDYMAATYTSTKNLRVERGFYKLIGVNPASEQSWPAYLRSILSFSVVGILLVYALQRVQQVLPYSLGLPPTSEPLAFNTAISFVTNTNWQSYSPDLTLGYTVQLVGLAVQNFLSAAVGLAVAVALIRGLSYRLSGTIGNFWVDLTRGTVRILLPLSVLAAIVLIAGGVIQNVNGFQDVTTLTGGTAVVPGGPVASQEAIKLLGTNGGGFFNANSAHPFENPTPWTSLFEVLLFVMIPFSLPRTFGRMVGDNRQGLAVVGAMAILFVASLTLMTWAELAGGGTAPQLAGGALEGKEQRFGILGSTIYATATSLTSTGSVNSMHDSYTSLGGGLAIVNMMLGEVAPGGVGAGLYGILVIAIIGVFIAGLMVGRTPEYLGKKIGAREIKLASLYILTTPTLVLVGTALSFAIPAVRDDVTTTSIWNPGLHGFSEVLYAFTSAANNNGSAFAGLTANTPWFNTALGVAMLLGRFLPIVFVLALAGSFAAQDKIPATAGTLPTHRPQFVGLLIGVVISCRLTYFPVLALGPWRKGCSKPCPPSQKHFPHRRDPGEEAAERVLVRPAGRRPARCLRKLDPRLMWRNPVMFIVEVGALLTTVIAIALPILGQKDIAPTFSAGIAIWLWITVIFANLRSRWPRAAARRRRRASARPARPPSPTASATPMSRWQDPAEDVSSADLVLGDFVEVSAGEVNPGDGDIVWGIASVDESAITGESAPVIREHGGDRSAVTGGTGC